MSKTEEYWQRYMAASHAMQSGVAMDHQQTNEKDASKKMLRTGINSSLVNSSALGKLLIDKGLITEEEYAKALAEGMEAEKARYEKILQDRVPPGSGTKITLA